MTSTNVILNKNNITNNSNSRFEYVFPQPQTFTESSSIALAQSHVYYSWFNISKKYNNNFFQYRWWDMYGNLTVIVDVVIDDGFYSINTLYEAFQFIMVKNGHYLENKEKGTFIYFIELLDNSTYYGVELRLSSASHMMDFGEGLAHIEDYGISLPTTFQLPPAGQFETPQVIIPANSNFGKLIGFEGTIYKDLIYDNPTKNETFSFLNTFVSTMTPSSSFIVTCSLVKNDMAIPNNVLTAFTLSDTSSWAGLISIENDLIYSQIKPGVYTSVILQIYDQEFRELQIIDSNILLMLSIKK
jgi:hypothetical protein